MKAIEISGVIDEQHRLVLDKPLSNIDPSRVRVIILVPEDSEIEEKEWLSAAAANPAFDFLRDPAEDVYARDDGKPFDDQG